MITKIASSLSFKRRRRLQKLDKLKKLSRPSFVSSYAKFSFHHNISIGRYCRIGHECHLDGEGCIEIGDGTIFAPKVVLLTSSHSYDQNQFLPYDNTDVKKPVRIGSGVWIGWGAIIMPGVSLGNGSVVAAGSVVVKDVAPGEIVGGNPAQRVSMRDKATDIESMVESEQYYLKALFSGEVMRSNRSSKQTEIVR